MRRELTQFVQLGVEAGREHAAVAQQHRRLVGDRRHQQLLDLARRVQRLPQHVEQRGGAVRHARQQLRQRLQRGTQAGQLARTHLAQRDARGDALDVGGGDEPVE